MFVRRALPIGLVIGWTLLLVAWGMGQAPFGAPDEGDHYHRAIGISEGVIIGKKPPAPQDRNDARSNWMHQTARILTIPAGKAQLFACFVGDPNISAACINQEGPYPDRFESVVNVGSYQPLPYLLPAAGVRLSDQPKTALYFGRLAGILAVLLLLIAAVAVLRAPDDSPLALLGLILAVTPMAIFVGASLNGSGLEIAAGIAFMAALMRLGRTSNPPNWVWVVTGISGSALALSRSITPAWVLLLLLLFVVLHGPKRSWQILRTGRRAAVAVGAIAIAMILNRIWEAAYGYHDVPIKFGDRSQILTEGWTVLINIADQFIGKFGYLEFALPLTAVRAWFIAIALLVVIALIVARWWQRTVLVGTVVVAMGIPMLLYMGLMRNTGFGLQGRHVLAVLIAVPLLAGELIYRNRDRLPLVLARGLAVVVPLLAATVQLVAWWIMARRYAVGVDGPLNFFGSAEWSPPLGWIPWAVLAAAGAASIAAGAAGSLALGKQASLNSS